MTLPRWLRILFLGVLAGLIISIIGVLFTDNARAASPAPGSLTGYSVVLKVSAPRKSADTLLFKFTASNNATNSLRNVVMTFSPNIRPWGLVDGHLTWTKDGTGLKWSIGLLRGGETRTIIIPVQAPMKSPARVCASASLSSSVFPPFWAKKACYWSS